MNEEHICWYCDQSFEGDPVCQGNYYEFIDEDGYMQYQFCCDDCVAVYGEPSDCDPDDVWADKADKWYDEYSEERIYR